MPLRVAATDESRADDRGAQPPHLDTPPGAQSPQRNLLSELIAQFDGALRRFLQRRLGNADEVDDALQETYLRLLAYRDAGHLQSPQALVFRVAKSVLLDRSRRRSVRHAEAHCALDGLDIEAAEPSQERAVAAQQEVLLLRQAIKELPPKCRQAFLLSRLRGLSYAQIAAQMGISVKMVEKHITHALALCRAKVGGRKP